MSQDRKELLIVDDEEDFLVLVGDFFHRRGYGVLTAADGVEALEIFDRLESRIDLVMTDMRMPRMGGAELIRELRQRRPYLPIIGITGHADLRAPLTLLDKGAYYYIEKPLPRLKTVESLVSSAIKLHAHEAELARIQENPSLADFYRPGLVDPDGNPIGEDSEAGRLIITDFVSLGQQLQEKLLAEPKLVHDLTPRQFEELVADLLHRFGYEVELTPESKDGGFDLSVATKGPLGSFLYLVECKKFRPDRPVGVELVRNLYGVVQHEGAAGGVLVSTSSFTKGAQELQKLHKSTLELHDYDNVVAWIEEAFRGPWAEKRKRR